MLNRGALVSPGGHPTTTFPLLSIQYHQWTIRPVLLDSAQMQCFCISNEANYIFSEAKACLIRKQKAAMLSAVLQSCAQKAMLPTVTILYVHSSYMPQHIHSTATVKLSSTGSLSLVSNILLKYMFSLK